jgi:hypothetical protein
MWVSCPRSEANKSFAWGHMSKCARRGSVAHESRTPYSELGSLRFLRTWKLGRAGFMGLTRVKARVHSILLKSMKINAKRQNKDALSYSRRPETPRPARTHLSLPLWSFPHRWSHPGHHPAHHPTHQHHLSRLQALHLQRFAGITAPGIRRRGLAWPPHWIPSDFGSGHRTGARVVTAFESYTQRRFGQL